MIVYTSKKRGRGILSNPTLDRLLTSRMVLEKRSHIVNETCNQDQRLLFGKFLDWHVDKLSLQRTRGATRLGKHVQLSQLIIGRSSESTGQGSASCSRFSCFSRIVR